MKRLVQIMLFAAASLLLFGGIAQGKQRNKLQLQLPKDFGAGSQGLEYYLSFHPGWQSSEDFKSDNVMIYINSDFDADVTVSVSGKSFNETKQITAGSFTEFEIPANIALCTQKTPDQKPVAEGLYPKSAIHISSTSPVTVFASTDFKFANEGYLAVPLSSLGNKYIVAAYNDPSDNSTSYLPSYVSIAAAFDNTEVRFKLGGNSQTRTVGGRFPGEELSMAMNKGDVWLIPSAEIMGDLSGSTINSTKPVAVTAGNYCANVPYDTDGCDYTAEMLLPMYVWGNSFVVPTIEGRTNNPVVRIFAGKDQARIYRDGNPIGIIPFAGGIINQGYLDMRSENSNKNAYVFSSDKPVSISLYNTGTDDDNAESSPFQMNLIPVSQFKTDYNFIVPGNNGSAYYKKKYAVLIYEPEADGSIPDDLELGGESAGEVIWQKVSDIDSDPGYVLGFPANGKMYNVKTIELPKTGSYSVKAAKPTGVYVYGTSEQGAYGYPAGMMLIDAEHDDKEAPKPEWSADCDGTVEGATVTDMPEDDSKSSKLNMIFYHWDESYNYNFHYDSFVPGMTKSISWKLNVKDKSKDARAVITFTDRSGNDTTIAVDYKAPLFSISPEYIDLGIVKLGKTAECSLYCVNKSLTSEVTVSSLEMRSRLSNFEIIGISLPITIPADDSVLFKVRFNALAAGVFTDSVLIGDDCLTALMAALHAEVKRPVIAADDLDFGDVTVNEKISKEVKIFNNSEVELEVFEVEMPSNTAYKAIFDTEIVPENPLLIEPFGEYDFTVEFTPLSETAYSDRIVFKSDAQDEDSITFISGRGVKPGLAANSIDWGKRRVDRIEYENDGPYPAENPERGIVLLNSGSQSVNISGIKIIKNVGGEAFQLTELEKAFSDLTIAPGEDTVIHAEFHPTNPGIYELVFQYANTAQSITETRLSGIGTVPRISKSTVDFDTTVMNDDKYNSREVSFMNEDWEFGDELIITDIIIKPNAGDVSEDGVNFGEQGFRFDKAAIVLPITLEKGKSLKFNVDFSAQHPEEAYAELWSVSDAENEQSVILRGIGNNSAQIEISGDNSDICVGDTDTLKAEIRNTGTSDIEIFSIRLEDNISSLSFADEADTKPFTLIAGRGEIIELLYKPTETEDFGVNIKVSNSTAEAPEIEALLSCRATQESINSGFEPMYRKVDISSPAELILKFDPMQGSPESLETIDVDIKYNSDFLELRPEQIFQGALTDGKYELIINDIDPHTGNASLTLKSIGGATLSSSGDFLQMIFASYLPKNDEYKSTIEAKLTAKGTNCVVFSETRTAGIELNPTCAFDLRRVTGSDYPYELFGANPNPVGAEGSAIEFAVGLKSHVYLGIYNSLGEEVLSAVDEELDPGRYTLSISADDLPSGVYWCRMNAGSFNQVRKLVIAK